MIRSLGRRIAVLSVLAVAVALPRQAAAEEEATINVFSVVEGQGQTLQTGAKEATFIGTLAGTLYAETDKGPVEVGALRCPATIKVGTEDATQKGVGSCAITTKDGAQMFAEISCSGVYLVGCDGELKLTGGTDRYAGITGGGPITFRSGQRMIAVMSEGGTKERGTSILVARGLRYRIP